MKEYPRGIASSALTYANANPSFYWALPHQWWIL